MAYGGICGRGLPIQRSWLKPLELTVVVGQGRRGRGDAPLSIFYHTYLSMAVVGGVDVVVVDEGACNMICVLHMRSYNTRGM